MGAHCCRPDCDQDAVARLAADFNRREGWLRDVAAGDGPHDYLLCGRHADKMSLPRSWVLHDERQRRGLRTVPTAPSPAFEPADPPPPPPVLEEVAPAAPAPQRSLEFDPAAEVDDSTPLLSRAFRAAVSGHGDES